MITFPNARITLGLWVTGRRGDGFHDIETLMVPVPVYDALEAVPSADGETRLGLSGLPVPNDGRPNLCLQAYELMQEVLTSKHVAAATRRQTKAHQATPRQATPRQTTPQQAAPQQATRRQTTARQATPKQATLSLRSTFSQYLLIPPLHIHLHKGIPAGAGLAGGSADAAFMLKMLNTFITPPLATSELIKLAEKLGSDCPFFMNNEAALATGRGNILSPHPAPADFHSHRLEIVTSGIHVSTAEAYRRIQPKERTTSLAALLQQPISKWKHLITNDFEKVVFEMHPELGLIKTRLYDQGAVYASLSGSGSAVYALF